MREPGWPFGNRPKPRRAWFVSKGGRYAECEINEHPLGWEVRVYVGGDFHYSHAFETEAQAERHASERRQELLVAGWNAGALGGRQS